MSVRQSSLFSFGSFRPSFIMDEEYEDMTDKELQRILEDTMQGNWVLAIENDVFERYLNRVDPQSVKTAAQMLDRAKYARRVSTQVQTKTSKGSMKISARMSQRISVLSIPKPSPSITSQGSGSRHGTPSILTTESLKDAGKLSIPHRIKMAKDEEEAMIKDLEEYEKQVARKKARLRAQIEELEIEVRESHETRDEFQETIVYSGMDPISKKIPAEKVVKFVDDWLKFADSIIERLRLKNTGLKIQINKTKQQLLQREELGEALRVVDFQQLNIENEHCMREIEEKNIHLLKMKKIAGRYNLLLTRHKQKLSKLLLSLDRVRNEIETKKEQIEKLQSESTVIEVDVEKAKEELTALIKLIDEYEVPDILDYVKVQAEYKDLQKRHRALSRRKKIEGIKYRSSQSK